jgi:hypothetical protein
MHTNDKRPSKEDSYFEEIKKSFHEKFPIESEESDGIEFRVQSIFQESADVSSIISLLYESEYGVTRISAVHNAITKEEWYSILEHLNTIDGLEYSERYQNPETLEVGIMTYLRDKDITLFEKALNKIVAVNRTISSFRAGELLHWRKPSMCED